MLLQLRIENFATIRELEVEFTEGFSILTGETGAGKSIMIDAILLLLGHRGDPSMIRTGKEQASVEGIFSVTETLANGDYSNIWNELERTGISLCDELIVRCLVSHNSRQKRYINGVSVTVDFLKNIGRKLINIHGQHENQSLLQVSSHLDFLDGYGQLLPLRKQVSEAFHSLKEAKKEQISLQKRIFDRAVRIDELKSVIADLNELNLQPSEEGELRKEENRLTHVEKLLLLLGQVRYRLQEVDGSIIEQLELSRKLLSEALQIDSECMKILSGIETALFQVEDSFQELIQYSDKIEDDPIRLAWINERLSRIQHFSRKYRLHNSGELLNLLEKSLKELDSIDHLDEDEQEICEKIEEFGNQSQKLAVLLSGKRRRAAKKMDAEIVYELRQLGMEKARFETHIVTSSFLENSESSSTKGIDQVEFMLTVNPGQDLRSLVKVASGGELSRIMLAIKTVLTSLDSVEILIFDEVDTGISGGIAEIVGQKLHSLGKKHQTLCVTHLPQIASFAEHHFLVSKYLKDNETFTKINLLKSKNERIRALADLIGGQEITKHSLELAQEMLNNFQIK